MAIKLENKSNVTAPGGDYPYGRIKDRVGSTPGTPVNEPVYGDFHQFFARLLALSGVVANGLVENLTNGWQYVEALAAYIRSVANENTVNSESVIFAVTTAVNSVNSYVSGDLFCTVTKRGNHVIVNGVLKITMLDAASFFISNTENIIFDLKTGFELHASTGNYLGVAAGTTKTTPSTKILTAVVSNSTLSKIRFILSGTNDIVDGDILDMPFTFNYISAS